MRVFVGGEKENALLEKVLDLWVSGRGFLVTEDRAQDVRQLRHGVGQCHQTQFVQLLVETERERVKMRCYITLIIFVYCNML